MRILIGIATAGRPAILGEMLADLRRQTRLPDGVIICPAGPDDIDPASLADSAFPINVVRAPAGLPSQRNAILAASDGYDAVVFFDDDFFPSQSYLANAEVLLTQAPEIVVATGVLLEDGINGPGLSVDHARRKLADSPESGPCLHGVTAYYGAYGCNMVVRLDPVRRNRLKFDEALPLYAWQEDIDFSRQLAPFGRIVSARGLSGIHLGAKRGRTSGVRLGYSQIANPVYLVGKGTMSMRFGGRTMARNLIANALRSVAPEPYVDRLGRLKGNLLALSDLLRGRLHPGRVLELD